ncbi:unnamed protein product [Sphenostylis stenocarpa]|uniref:Uncharacterized protein n=1 Tax=Sphenostylis stenocarpa TaxID=92480 RepID=A0AA86VXU8_9FABA|nr:unnamed protein product [Sphenostylis stenocarpa]
MFGSIRASTSSLETLEDSPSKILKDDSFSIYEPKENYEMFSFCVFRSSMKDNYLIVHTPYHSLVWSVSVCLYDLTNFLLNCLHSDSEATLMKLKIGARIDTSEVMDDSSVSSPCAKEVNQPDVNPESTSCSETTMMDRESENSSPTVTDHVSSGKSDQRRQFNLSILNFFKFLDTGHACSSSSAETTTSTENGSTESISSTSVESDYRSEVDGVQILQDCEMSD